MKIHILNIFFLLLSHNLFSQFNAYYPDGRKITLKFETINQLLDSLGYNETETYRHNLGEVYFKRLTNQPIFILFDKKSYPTKIKEIISSYNYQEYLNSYSYYWDLKDMISENTLTKKYLKDNFKEPDIKDKIDDGSEYWIYKNYNLKIIFDGENPKSADVINYKAIQKNELAIPTFNVTGSDYTIGFDISLSNLGKKTIKYSFITVTATNPVNDKVGTKVVKAVGPIEPTETGEYEFEDVIYSRVAKYLAIENIKLQYMDGTVKIISKNEIQKIRITDWEEVGNRVIDN